MNLTGQWHLMALFETGVAKIKRERWCFLEYWAMRGGFCAEQEGKT